MKNLLVIFYLIISIISFSQKSDIEIEWLNVKSNNISTSTSLFNVKACINTHDSIKLVELYQNNILIKQIGFSDKVKFRNTCDYSVEKNIELKQGDNIIKLIVKTNKATKNKTLKINYQLIKARFYALIIGVEEYNDEKIKDLTEPINDATKLKDILVNDYSFEEENIIFLKNPRKEKIIGELNKMRSYINKNDNLLIFYAGHGFWDEGMNLGYWFPSDSKKDNPVNWLSNTTLINYLSAIHTKNTLLISDACFSGGILKTRSVFANENVVERLYQLPSRKALTSGTLNEVPDNSVFMKYLIKKLQENKQKYLTAEQLYSQLKYPVLNNSSNIPQYGTIQNTGDEGGDFIFIKRFNDNYIADNRIVDNRPKKELEKELEIKYDSVVVNNEDSIIKSYFKNIKDLNREELKGGKYIYLTNQKVERDEYSIEFDKLTLKKRFISISYTIKNKSDKYLIYNKAKSVMVSPSIDFLISNPKIIVNPNSEFSDVVLIKRRNKFLEKALVFNIKGLQFLSNKKEVDYIEKFRIPVLDKTINSEMFDIKLLSLKREPGLTSVYVFCKYIGNDIGVIQSNKALIKASGKDIIYPNRVKEKPIYLTKGKGVKVKFEFYIPIKVIDMRYTTLYVLWKNTFSQSRLIDLPSEQIFFKYEKYEKIETL